MKIFKTTTRKIILLIFVFVFTFNTLAFAGTNPSRAEIESMIEEVAQKRAIPSILLKAIARVESVYEHYNSDGSPKITGSSIGLMQINNRYGGYNLEKLKYDIEYNIEAGADVLLNKWSMSSYQSVSSVGNMDPNILENWYFALWAYNGWAQSNNPNMVSTYRYTYQQLVYDVIKKEYGGTINNIDFSYLPSSGKPSRSLVVPTPAYTNSGNIVMYENGDYVRTDGIRDAYQLRDEPAGKYIHQLEVNQLGTVTDGPVLKNGYYWYKVYVSEGVEGWIERNWLLRTGDIEHGRYVFDDISFHWARKAIMDLYNRGIISESESFNPDKTATKEEFLILLGKAIDLSDNEDTLIEVENSEIESKSEEADVTLDTSEIAAENTKVVEDAVLPFSDAHNINPWAVEYVEEIYDLGLLDSYREELEPLEKLTRKEATLIMEGIFEEDHNYDSLNIDTIFNDLGSLSDEEKAAVKEAYTNGLISGKYSGSFCPDDYLSRAEAAALMLKISNKIEQTHSMN